ncbi:LysR family transcriptional regulator [Ideonella sp. DXS29W]|uniref:LysR family transcriptional regulator n=1 Tax=Ideonella lacteola TaxID=2984193 RepID=A0ABU9BUJ3_9BURK
MTRRASSLDPGNAFAGDAARRLAPIDEAELRQLRLFCVVVAAGGFSAATAELQADLSTISRQFKELETRAGVKLAQRGRGGFALTPAGEQLHHAAQALLGSWQGFREQLATLDGTSAPQLRLGIVDGLWTAPGAPLPRALAACVKTLPRLRLHLHSLRPIEIERRILAGELEAGVLASHPPAAGLQQHTLYAEANSLYVAPGHPWFERADEGITRQHLTEIDVVCDPYSVDLPASSRLVSGPGAPRADSIEAGALLVASGCYAGFLPDHYVQASPFGASWRRVHPALFSYRQDIVLCCRRGQVEAPVRTLLRALAP